MARLLEPGTLVQVQVDKIDNCDFEAFDKIRYHGYLWIVEKVGSDTILVGLVKRPYYACRSVATGIQWSWFPEEVKAKSRKAASNRSKHHADSQAS